MMLYYSFFFVFDNYYPSLPHILTLRFIYFTLQLYLSDLPKYPNIHPSISYHHLSFTESYREGGGAYSSYHSMKAGSTMDKLPVYRRNNTKRQTSNHTCSLELSSKLTHMFFDCGRRTEYPEKTGRENMQTPCGKDNVRVELSCFEMTVITALQ